MDELFNKIGLNNNEREVYLAVLKAGKVSPQRVSVLTDINRTTVYSVAKKLQSMGLITEDLGQKVGYLVAVSPENLARVFEKEEKKIIEKKNAAIELAKELTKLSGEKQYSVPRIKFIEEGDLSEYLYAEHDRWSESAEKYGNVWWGYQDDSFTTNYRSWIDWANERSKPDLQIKLFFNKVPLEQEVAKKYATRVMRHLPDNAAFDTSLFIAGDYILMAQTRARPHYLVEIYDAVLARNQRQLFKNLWEMAASQGRHAIVPVDE